jgi:hypothetical protein
LSGIVRHHKVAGLGIPVQEAIEIARRVLSTERYQSVAIGPTAATFVRSSRPAWVPYVAFGLAIPTIGLSLFTLLIKVQESCTVTAGTSSRGTSLSLSGVLLPSTLHNLESSLRSGSASGDAYDPFPGSASSGSGRSGRRSGGDEFAPPSPSSEGFPVGAGFPPAAADYPEYSSGYADEPADYPPPLLLGADHDSSDQGEYEQPGYAEHSGYAEQSGFEEPEYQPDEDEQFESPFPDTPFPLKPGAALPLDPQAEFPPKVSPSAPPPTFVKPTPSPFPAPPTPTFSSLPDSARQLPPDRNRSPVRQPDPARQPEEPGARGPWVSAEPDFTMVRPLAAEPTRPMRSDARRWILNIDDGRTLAVEDFALIGRDPEPGPDDPAGSMVPMNDPEMSVSKTHAAFGVDRNGLWFLDRYSTNGTAMVPPGAGRIALQPGVRTAVPAGSEVWIGRRCLRVEQD